jgi:hypothetical protein
MTLYFTNDEQKEFEESLKEVHFHSKFGFANSTRGFRKGNLHLFIAGTGGGKSTIVRSLVRDILFHPENNPIIGFWFSEESVKEYIMLLSQGLPSSERLLRTEAFSEQDNPQVKEKDFFEWLNVVKPHVLIFDNITTSKFYEGKGYEAQAAFAAKLKTAIKAINCACLVVAHSDSQQTSQKGGMLDINNIRGAKTICNLCEFAYLVQGIATEKDKYTVIRVAKSRSQNIVHDTYLLQYNPHTFSYMTDTAIPFKRFKELYDQRNRL